MLELLGLWFTSGINYAVIIGHGMSHTLKMPDASIMQQCLPISDLLVMYYLLFVTY